MLRTIGILALTGTLAACGSPFSHTGSPAVSVTATGETEPVGTGNSDAADDPAIWRNVIDPAASLIVATDKKAGLYVYGLDGKARDFDPDGRLNNVDLKDLGPQESGGSGVIVVASDRNNPAAARLRLYRLDPNTAKLAQLGVVPGGSGEAYGLCLHQEDGVLFAFSVLKDGTISEYRIDLAEKPRSKLLREMKLETQAEGCVVDPRDGTLYVGEEDVGIWRFAPGKTEGDLVAKADGKQLVADVEGLAIMTRGKSGGWLLASSQGDNAYARYRLPGMEPAGRFRITEGKFGATEETDGIDLMSGSFGSSYPAGLFVAQDGENGSRAQNFKLVSWKDIETALTSAKE